MDYNSVVGSDGLEISNLFKDFFSSFYSSSEDMNSSFLIYNVSSPQDIVD